MRKMTPMLAALLALAGLFTSLEAAAQEGAAPVKPIFESKKGWKFEDEMLVFFNESPNPGGARFLRWEGYTWIVSGESIVCIDPRPYGTSVQGTRFQAGQNGKEISDKDLMNDLKKEAENIREEKDPNDDGLPVSIDVGVGFGFRF